MTLTDLMFGEKTRSQVHLKCTQTRGSEFLLSLLLIVEEVIPTNVRHLNFVFFSKFVLFFDSRDIHKAVAPDVSFSSFYFKGQACGFECWRICVFKGFAIGTPGSKFSESTKSKFSLELYNNKPVWGCSSFLNVS